ncbi:unnamed protein product [Peronospora belbahrii]|uniref:Uncharacterized protein n=1 Tax=Peronospora belbahrii TaxID=622444 RepID=A0AAU9LDY4_9STRA|nr:unnamed protein product [Peronospora belbahrii]
MPPTSHQFFHFTPVMMKNIKEAATCGGFDKDGVNEFSYVSTIDAITALFTVLMSTACELRRKCRLQRRRRKLARRLRESIIQSDEIFLRDAINFLAEHSNAGCVQLSNNFLFGPDLVFSSWVHLGMYNAEFDGTHPWYASFPRMTCYDGRVIITEAQKGGEGIDVGVFLVSKAMEKLKKMFSEVSYLYERPILVMMKYKIENVSAIASLL